MHITILGASHFGVATAKQMIADGHEVVLIDEDRVRLDELSEELDCGMIHGDGTLPSVLRDAFGDGSDAFIALTNEDNVNILASIVAKSVGYKRVIPQIVRPELLTIAEELSLDETITPHESVARSIASALEQHSRFESDLSLRNELRILSLHVPDTMEPVTIADLRLPAKSRVIARIRDRAETLVNGDTQLRAGDALLIVVEHDDQERVQMLFNSTGDV